MVVCANWKESLDRDGLNKKDRVWLEAQKTLTHWQGNTSKIRLVMRPEYFKATDKITDESLTKALVDFVSALTMAFQALCEQPHTNDAFDSAQSQSRRDAKRAIIAAMEHAGWEHVKRS